MNLDSRIYVAGHNGMVGSAIVRKLRELGYKNIITASRKEVNLLNQMHVQSFFSNATHVSQFNDVKHFAWPFSFRRWQHAPVQLM